MENSTTPKFFTLCGLEDSWMNKSVYFPLTLVTYLLIITVNVTLIITVILEKALHKPIYIFICNLSIIALYGTAGFYPVFLHQLLLGVREISYGACFTQTYLIYTSIVCEITNISLMAFDRYAAICRPLHYHGIMSPLNVGRLLLVAWLYPLLGGLVALFLTIRIPLCGSVIYKLFCDNPSILSHSCGKSPTANRIWSNVFTVGNITLALLITVSYCQIVKVCLTSTEGRNKFTQTCVPHLLTMVVFILGSSFDVFYGWQDNVFLPLGVRNAIGVQILVIPPLFNPLIYGLNLQQIRSAFLQKMKRKTYV